MQHISILSDNLKRDLQKYPNKYTRIESGFKDLDKLIGSWNKGDLVVIVGRTGIGKTTFALSMLVNMLVTKPLPIAVFYLEQTANHLYNKLLCIGGIPIQDIEDGSYMEKFEDGIQKFNNLPLYISTPNSISLQSLCDEIRTLVSDQGVEIVFVDYIQLVTGFGKEGSRVLKSLAKELNITIFVLSQTSKNSDKRYGEDGIRPILSDLSNAGSLSDDADVVCFVHRAEYYRILEDERGKSLINLVDIIVAKNRNGLSGMIHLRYRPEFRRIINEYRDSVQSFNDIEDMKAYILSLKDGEHNEDFVPY